MAEYTQLRNDVWQDPEFETLPPAAKLLWLNLLTTPARNTAGLFQYSIGRMAFETGLDRDDVSRSLGVLGDLGWVEYDQPTGAVWVVNFVRKQPCGPTMIPKIKRDIEESFSPEHPLVQRFKIRYAHLYGDPISPTDTQQIPDEHPTDTGHIGPARKHGTARHGTARNSTAQSKEGELAELAAAQIESDSTVEDLQAVIARAIGRGMGSGQIEGIIYQLADWWPTRPAKAQKRRQAHRTLQGWLVRETPRPDPPPIPDASYPDVVVPEDW